MINQIDSIAWFKLNGLLRSFIAHGGLLGFAEVYIVAEYPKSGGTWLSQLLSDALGVPFPRNRLPNIGTTLLHGHYSSNWNMKNPIVIWRDGRDVIVSQYYHTIHLAGKSEGPRGRVSRALNFSDIDDIVNNLPRFIEFMFASSRKKFSHTWPEFVNYWSDIPNVIETNYESLRENTAQELEHILNKLTSQDYNRNQLENIVEKYSFLNQSGRKPGREKKDSFFRKGIIGDWKNCFNQESKDTFYYFAGNQLIKLGYEEDSSWCTKPA